MWNPFKSKKAKTEALCPVNTGDERSALTKRSEYDAPTYNQDMIPADGQDMIPADGQDMIPAEVNQTIAIVNTAADLAHKALDVYQTSLQVEQNIAALRAASDVQLAQITSKFEFCKAALDHVFQDRHSALSAHYCVLGDAMKANDREMIINALRGISAIVVTSPLSDFKEIVNNWDSYNKKKPLELDF